MALTVVAVLGLYFLLGGLRSSAVPVYQDSRGDALLGPALPNSAAAGGETATSVLSQSMDLLSKGKLEVVEGIETVWQLPPEGTPTKGVLFVAHGCNHGAIDWWPKSDSCPSCMGLPEEMNITLHALKRGCAVVAVSSADREGHRCWQGLWGPRGELLNRSDGESDWIRVELAPVELSTLRNELLLSVLLGAASCFVHTLARHLDECATAAGCPAKYRSRPSEGLGFTDAPLSSPALCSRVRLCSSSAPLERRSSSGGHVRRGDKPRTPGKSRRSLLGH